MRRWATVLLEAAVMAGCAYAGELWVDGAAGAGDGSAAKPFPTIGEACKAAKGADVITVRAGVYREAVSIAQSGTAEQPTTLRAAQGQRVIISGFAPITGWKDEGGGIFSATIQGDIADLYVGVQRQPVSRWPDLDSPMRRLVNAKADASTFADAGSLADVPFLKEVAASPRNLMAFMFVAQGNFYTTAPVAALDLKTAEMTLANNKVFASLKGASDRYELANHRALIQKPGQWAFEKLQGNDVRVYFRPSQASDLEKTQFPRRRQLVYVGHHQNRVSNVRIEGLEFQGSAGTALEISNAQNVTVAGNIACFNVGHGITSRNCTQITVRNNVVLANGQGVSIASTAGALVEGNEIGLNMVDGLVVAGNVSGRPGREPESTDVTVRRNYIHHHLLMGHPDNIQTYRGVKNLRIEDNLALWGGQGIMTEETEGAVIQNSVFAGTAAITVIFGHSNSNNWTVTNSTIGLGGWGIFSLTGKEYHINNNILWAGALPLPETLVSDYNVFYQPDPSAPIARTVKPFKNLTTVDAIVAAMHQDQHSVRADAKFRNAPFCQAVAPWDDANRPDQLSLLFGNRKDAHLMFAKGDRVEITGDGVLREVTEVTPEYIRFQPPLPGRPFRDALIWNWKSAKSPVLDLRIAEDSPAAKAGESGKPVGANINIPAYQQGDFDGDGKRDLPTVPEEINRALPNPSNIVVPLQGA